MNSRKSPGRIRRAFGWRAWIPPGIDDARLTNVWASAQARIARDDLKGVNIDSEKLNGYARQAWDRVAWWKKAVAYATLPGTLAAGIQPAPFIPVDFGASVILLASVKELLVATGIAALFNAAAISKLVEQLEEEAGVPQIGKFWQMPPSSTGPPECHGTTMAG